MPYRNQPVVAEPFGFAVALSTAAVAVMPVAGSVETTGAAIVGAAGTRYDQNPPMESEALLPCCDIPIGCTNIESFKRMRPFVGRILLAVLNGEIALKFVDVAKAATQSKIAPTNDAPVIGFFIISVRFSNESTLCTPPPCSFEVCLRAYINRSLSASIFLSSVKEIGFANFRDLLLNSGL